MLKSTFTLCLLLATAGVETPALQDEQPAANTYNGPSSARFARGVTLRFDDKLPEATPVASRARPGRTIGESSVGVVALRRFALSSARRHFEDARWDAPAGKDGAEKNRAKKNRVKKKKRRKQKHPTMGREVVIRQISIEASDGPSYNVIVQVDRVSNGRRLGSATGRGYGMPDRTRERTAAAFAPGVLGMIAGQKAMKPNLDKDHAVIEQAVLRALDSALLQLSAVWASEQLVEEMQRKQRR